MRQCKYIMVDDNLPVLFHCGMDHAFVAKRFRNITSAGFVQVYSNIINITSEVEVSVEGESLSLKLKPAKDDAYWIKKMLTE